MFGKTARLWFVSGTLFLGCLGAVQASNEPTLAELSASVSSEVEQDQVQIVLSAQAREESAVKVNQRLTEMIANARERLGSPKNVRISTGSIQTYPRYDDAGKISGWQGRADLFLRSNDVSAAASSADTVTDLLTLSGVTFSLSDFARRAEQSRLMDSVAHAFREKATTTARVFGYSGFQIQRLNVTESDDMPSPRPMMMAARMSDVAEKKTSLTLLPGVQNVSVTVSGLIELR